MTLAVINAIVRPLLETRLPDWVEPHWFETSDQLLALAPQAEIGWFDTFDFSHAFKAYRLAEKAKWLNTMAAGVEAFPLDLLRERGVTFTNGAGLNARAVAEYAVMGILTVAKGWREVVHAQDRGEWLREAPGQQELSGSRALIVGAGGIGGRIGELLRGFGVEVTEVRRTPAPGALTADEWRDRLGEFDWVVITVPSTPGTAGMMGAAEFAAMKRGAAVFNFSRGAVLDQQALMAALDAGQIGAAFLDVTEPEPLPPDHPLWDAPGTLITPHVAGDSPRLWERVFALAHEQLRRLRDGEPLLNVVEGGY